MIRMLSAGLVVLVTMGSASADNNSKVQFKINDEAGRPVPCRVHLKNEKGEPQRAGELPFWRDHFACPGAAVMDLNPGVYTYEIERGPEYSRASGKFEVSGGQPLELTRNLKRISDLRKAGWYSGDLHVHRPLADIELLMQAEDLDFAPVITWWNNRNPWKESAIPNELTRKFDGHRLYDVMAGEDEREGGALLYFGLNKPLGLMGSAREIPSPMEFVQQARKKQPGVWIDIEKPFWWDVPAWLASGNMNSMGLANNHMCRSQMLPNEAWGKPRNAERLPGPLGNGFWTQEIYYHALNSGLRLPPSAGSASGVLPNPVGYNRVYVHSESPLTREAWFAALSEGKCFVTNGPLLLVKANQKPPGAVFQTEKQNPLAITLEIEITSNDPISRLELIQNGQVAQTADCTADVAQKKSFTLTVNQPGWFLVRALADVKETFRFASTGPWYVETPQAARRIERESAQFFLDWTGERISRVERNLAGKAERRDVLHWHEQAREFWQNRVNMANH